MSTENDKPELTDEEQFAAYVAQQEAQEAADAPATGSDAPTAAPAAADDTPKEPIPGYSMLSEEGRAAVDAALAERETLKKNLAATEQQKRAQQGQLRPTQQKAAELERQNVELLNRLKALEKTQADSTTAASTQAFQAYKAQFPDEAAVIEQAMTPLQAKIAQLERQLEDVGKKADFAERTTKHDLTMRKETSVVLQVHPDAAEVIDDPAFKVWVAALDDEDKARAASKDGRVAAKVLTQFKQERDYAKLLAQQNGDQKPATPAAQPSKPNKPRLDVEPNPRNRQSPAPRGNAYGSAEEEAYAQFVEQMESRERA